MFCFSAFIGLLCFTCFHKCSVRFNMSLLVHNMCCSCLYASLLVFPYFSVFSGFFQSGRLPLYAQAGTAHRQDKSKCWKHNFVVSVLPPICGQDYMVPMFLLRFACSTSVWKGRLWKGVCPPPLFTPRPSREKNSYYRCLSLYIYIYNLYIYIICIIYIYIYHNYIYIASIYIYVENICIQHDIYIYMIYIYIYILQRERERYIFYISTFIIYI